MIVGTLTLPNDQWLEFIDGEWDASSPELLAMVNDMFPPSSTSPADGLPGIKLLADAGELFGVEPVYDQGALDEMEDDPEDAIY